MKSGEPTAEAPNGPPAAAAPEPSGFKDRRTGLIVFGALLLLMALAGLGAAALQLVMLVGGEAMGAASADSSLYVFAALFYLLVAATAAGLGVGSIRCRRWARTLIVVLAALTLASGVVTTFYFVLHAGTMTEMVATQSGDEEIAGFAAFILGCLFAFFGFLFLVLPTVFLLFYRSRHVKATCEHYDPKRRWTDRYPAPLLAGVVVLLFCALIFCAPLVGAPVPFFGALLTGVPAWIYSLIAGLAALVLALGFLRFDRRAWIGSVVYVAAVGVSAFLSFRGRRLLSVYESMGYPPEQIEMMESFDLTRGFGTMVLLTVLLLVVYFAWLGRYFGDREPA